MAALAETGSPDAPAPPDVVLGPGTTVRGRVSARDGTPRAGVLVSAALGADPRIPHPFPSAVSDDHGRCVLERVPVGPMVLAAGTVRLPFVAAHGAELEMDVALV